MLTGENMRPLFLLEDEHHDIKIKGDTRIPAGAYFLKFNKVITPLTSKYRKRFPWFTFHIEITGIKNFSNVYYHIGNDERDTAGCPLVGLVCDMSSGDGVIQRSTQAYEIFYKHVSPWLMAGEEVIVNITDPR
jgi:hypothetical protein